MKSLTQVTNAFLCAALVLSVAVTAFQSPRSTAPHSEQATRPLSLASLQAAYGNLPLSFEANQGQTDAQVDFVSRGNAYNLFLTQTGAVLSLRQAAPDAAGSSADGAGAQPSEYAVLRMRLAQANPAPEVAALDELPGTVNYLIGSDPAAWRTNIPTFAKVAYRGVYAGVDLVYYGNQGQLEYDFIVAPGADPGVIALDYAGADSLAIDTLGDLVLRLAGGELRQLRPIAYQEMGGSRQAVASEYVLIDQQQVGIHVGAYDHSRALVIDPMLVYSTFLGGGLADSGQAIAVDATGSAYVTGEASSTAFPTTVGAVDTSHNGGIDVFVSKLNPAGTALVYSTYLGGSGTDQGRAIAVDSSGSAYLTGITQSSGFPTTAGAFDTTFNGGSDAFVTKLNPAGSALAYSTFLGFSGNDQGAGIALDSAGNAYVTGQTNSATFPTTVGAFDTTVGGVDAFVTKVNPAGSSLAYSSYLGGGSTDTGAAIAVDTAGSAYVTGQTASSTFPTTLGALDTLINGTDAFVTKFNPAGSALAYSTFLGGGLVEAGQGIAVDNAGAAYVTGETDSTAFPTTAGAFDLTHNGGTDAFVTKLNAAGSAPLIYSTYLGGSGNDEGNAIALDSGGRAHVTGQTTSSDFPTTAGTLDASFNGGAFDAFVAKLHLSGSSLIYSTYLGGSALDQGNGIAVDGGGSAYVTGVTASSSFPTIAGSVDTAYNGSNDVFVAKLTDVPVPATLVLAPAASTSTVGTQHCVTATVTDVLSDPTPGILVRFSVAGSVTTGGSAATDANGQAQFCYTGPAAPGADALSAYADTDEDNTQDAGEPSGAATQTWVPGEPATLLLTPAADSNPVGTQHCVTAAVTDGFGNPTPNISVRFSVSGATNASGSAATDAGGQAQFCYTGPAAPGADAITAYADTDGDSVADLTEPLGAAAKVWVPGAPASLILTPAAATNPVGTEHCVTAAVADAFGNPTPDIVVPFSVLGAVTTSGAATTDANGEAQFCYTGPPTPGTDTITAYADTDADNTPDAGEPAGTATKVWIPGAPASLTLAPLAATNPVGTQHCVVAIVTDAFSNPTPDIVVRFSVAGAVTAGGAVTTDANGEAQFCYTGPTWPGADTITAYADTDTDNTLDIDEPAGAATKAWIPGAPATITLTPIAATNLVGTQHCVTATVTDAFGSPTPDVTVRFSVSGSGSTSGSADTDVNGEAEFCYTGPTAPGADAIAAYSDTDEDNTQDVGEPFSAATKTWVPGAPATLTLTPAAATNPVGTQHCLTAAVADSFDNPTPDIVVRFSVAGSVATSGPVTTDANGQAEFCYSGPTTPGADSIVAYADTDADDTPDVGEPAGTAAKIWVPGAPASVFLTPAAATNPVGTQHCVTATVTDAFGNPTPDVSVRFTVMGSSSADGSGATDASGAAEFCYSGPTVPGTDVITAYADTNADSTQDPTEPLGAATKIWVPGAPATLTLAPATATNAVGTQDCVVATVQDVFGNPVAGISVRFTAAGANSAVATDTTDAAGEAEFCYAGTVAGGDTISAYADSDADDNHDPGEPSGAAAKTWTEVGLATLTLSPKTATNVVSTQHCVTASVADAFSSPAADVTVRFSVSGAVNTSGSTATDASGQAAFCYMGPVLPGADDIYAYADTDSSNTQEAGEPSDTAAKVWTVPPGTAFCQVKLTQGGVITAANGDRATFGGNAKLQKVGLPSGQEEYQDHGPAQPINVHSIQVLAVTCNADKTQATIYGLATINGAGSFAYRIQVEDLGEPGVGQDTYWITLSNGYDSGKRILIGGNIQIHK